MFLDLKELVGGRRVERVDGYVTSEFSDDNLFFKLVAIVLEGGEHLSVEGEHDLPYLVGIPEETLARFHKEGE
jgi:hypothetical protein